MNPETLLLHLTNKLKTWEKVFVNLCGFWERTSFTEVIDSFEGKIGNRFAFPEEYTKPN